MPNFRPAPFLTRFNEKLRKRRNGCWVWLGAKSAMMRYGRGGYGQIWYEGKLHYAHRAVLLDLGIRLPRGAVVDHLCRNHGCVNPAHLRVVSHQQNILAGTGASARHAKQRVCLRGHPLTDENLYRWPGNPKWRWCRACIKLRQEKKKWKRNQKKDRT